MIKETIRQLKKIVAESENGHLPLSYRIELMKQVGDISSEQKIMCECCKKACSFWELQNSDNIMLLVKINDYLYKGNGTIEDILKDTNKLRLYVESNLSAADTFVNSSIVLLGYAVCYNTAYMLEIGDYSKEDGEEPDSKKWNPDFVKTTACSVGNSIAEDGKCDTEKCREYWNWYLDMVLSICENPQQEVIPFYTGNNHGELHIPVPYGCTPALSDKIDQLNSALNSYIHAPTNRKETERMKPYAEDSDLVRVVAGVIGRYSCIPSTPQEKEDYRITGNYNYDIIRFWYCVALLAQSPDKYAIACLSGLAHTLMKHGPGEIGILYRILLLLPEQEHLHELTQELSAYYQEIIPDLQAAKWLAKAGIAYPDSFEWSVSFRFTSDGERALFPGNKSDPDLWFSLDVKLFSPQALYGDYTRFTSYQISVKNSNNSIHGQWNEKHGYLLKDNHYLLKDEHYAPEHLVALMYRLSDFGIRFSKVPAAVSVSRGVSGKAVKKWIQEEMETYEHDCMEEVRNQALNLYREEGDVCDTLNEIREKWSEEIPLLKDSRFDEVAMQYSCFSHETGIMALGQELTAYGYALYDLNGDDIYQLALLPQAEMHAFEEKCRKYGQYCKLLKQARYDFGMKAKSIKLRKQMPRERMAWPDDGHIYITRGFAGYFVYGEWRQADVKEWQGTFVADLRVTPLQPVKLKTKKIHTFIYSEKLDFYAALYSVSFGEMVIGGKNPLEAEKWPRMSGLSVYGNYEFRWCGRYLCLGDVESAIIHTMSGRGVEHVSRLVLPKDMTYPPSFGIDGKDMLYILLGEFYKSQIFRYEGDGKYYKLPFCMSGYDRFYNGCIPVPDTSRLLLLGEYTARSNSGIWMEPGLLDLDMATQRCRIAPLRMGDGSFRLRTFHKEWVLVESISNGNRTDYARFWNRKTDEVLRLRPGVYGNESFVSLHAMPDGTIIVNTLDDVGDVLSRVDDFWDFIRTASRYKKLGYWLNYPEPYPAREYELPPLSEDVTLMLPPPYTEPMFVSLLSAKSANSAVHNASATSKDSSGNGNSRQTDTGNTDGSDGLPKYGIEIIDGVLKINGQTVDMPLSYTAMVNMFGKERIVMKHRTMEDDKGRTVQYDRRSFLVWDNAGVVAVRNEENAYNISAIYLWVDVNNEPASHIPVPSKVFSDDITVNGIAWDRKSDMNICSGSLEISASAGYMEITFAGSRDRKDTWQHYRDIMAEHLQAALMDRDRVRQLERNGANVKSPDTQSGEVITMAGACKSFLEHTLRALNAGYSMGRSVRYLKNTFMLLLTEAVLKCSEHASVTPYDMLSVYSGCVILGYEKVNMKRFCEKLAGNGISDFVYDSLTRCIVPDWELSEDTVFPDIKEWIVSRHAETDITEAEAALKEISCLNGNVLIVDAIMEI